MPLLHHGNSLRSRISSIASPSWWRQQLSKFDSNNDDDTKKTSTTSSTGTTRDWRSLSPNKPPLPFVLDHDPTGTTSNLNPLISQSSERAPKRIPIPNKYRQSLNDGQLRKLSTIIEESDLLTEISVSPRSSSSHRRHLQQQEDCRFMTTDTAATSSTLTHHDSDKNNDITAVPSPSLPPNDSPHPSSSGSTSPALPSNDSSLHSSSLSISPVLSPSPSSSNNNTNQPSTPTPYVPHQPEDYPAQQAPTESTSSTSSGGSSLSSSTSSSSSSASIISFQPPPAWPIHPKTELCWSSTPSPLPTNEKKAKRKFAKMIQAAFRFRQEHQSKMPSEMETLFDPQDNVYKLRLWTHDKIQYHSFQGDAQYIPPELSSRRAYHCDMVDVWVLGISLYRMLVGKYPFYANNDRRLFNKMQHADFGIPSHLSPDLVMFHPWLKPYSVNMSTSMHKREHSISATTTTTTTNTNAPIIPSPRVVPDPKPTIPTIHHPPPKPPKAKSLVAKVIVFIVRGPFPPPSHPYRDLGPQMI
ncbi:hypothetical protein [Absidia glauca]|uniref:Protein kinase domain-containing protein n=1 Tax=Absidia glauca TaxID=4829 RepID=A0A168MMJ0_ABSGL|nr:hypothetical protein [Absidia glauca]